MNREKDQNDLDRWPDLGGIGMNNDGTLNVVPPDELDARYAEVRAMRIAEGFYDETPEPGIGVLPDGTLNIVNRDDPPFKPRILPDET